MNWRKELRLLLIYKDPMGHDPLSGSRRVNPSVSIMQHVRSANGSAQDLIQLPLFGQPPGNSRCLRAVPEGCTVWGWWRKSWEGHQRLLDSLQAATRKGHRPVVYLYNQYMRRLYHATLFDLYFEPGLTSVLAPSGWAPYCPDSYSQLPHLCGAFFLLKIDQNERNAAELQDLFTDSSSFELHGSTLPILAPDGVEEAAARLIDAPPRRHSLRATEQTMFVLRSFTQVDETANRLVGGAPESEVVEAIRETSWDHLLSLLAKSSRSSWARLAAMPAAVNAIGVKARENGSRITRFDFELFARASAQRELAELLCDRDSEEFGTLGEALLQWLTSRTERDARRLAAQVFSAAWGVCQARYGFAPMPDAYFKRLPAIEAIASAVKYDIGQKFYRDHLSHNVRAALLAACLVAGKVFEDRFNDLNSPIIGFLSGLFHDIALPLSTFPDTVSRLALALQTAQLGGDHGAAAHNSLVTYRVLDRQRLRKSLNYVATLSAIPNLPAIARKADFRPWESQASVLQLTQVQILVEELLCMSSDEHALVSAALVFDYAARGTLAAGADDDFDKAVRTLLPRMMGASSTPSGRELACILQCMALHDRRPSAKHHGVSAQPRDTPVPLVFSEFPLASAVLVADELQEWGRTLGPLDEVGAVDASIRFDTQEISAQFELEQRETVFSRTPFSPLEYLFGKVRTLGGLRRVIDSEDVFDLDLALARMEAFQLIPIVATEICDNLDVGEAHQHLDFSRRAIDQGRKVVGGPQGGSHVFGIGLSSGGELRDILKLDAHDNVLKSLLKITKDGCRISAMRIRGSLLILKLAEDVELQIRLSDYSFGELHPRVTPSDRFPLNVEIGFVSGALETLLPGDENIVRRLDETRHLRPHPHFLDFDWRFEPRTCATVVGAARAFRRRGEELICYLGCPTLGLWHDSKFPEEEDWLVLDRGHFALDEWLGNSLPEARFQKYDVREPVPPELKGKAAVVVTDPPWYVPEYVVFARRAVELLRPGGVLGITYYPPSLDESKASRFKKSVFQEIVGQFGEFGSVEIAYSIPEFEKATDSHEEFQHPELRIYRAGYMDFFQSPAKWEPTSDAGALYGTDVVRERFGRVERLRHGHHLRIISEEEWEQLGGPVHVALQPEGIKRRLSVPNTWIAWSSRNTIVRKTRAKNGIRVGGVKELCEAVERFEEGRRNFAAGAS